MPFLSEINTGAIPGQGAEQKLESLVKQLNEWGRLISNEAKTQVIRGDLTTSALILGEHPDGTFGILLNDGENDRLLIGFQEDGFSV